MLAVDSIIPTPSIGSPAMIKNPTQRSAFFIQSVVCAILMKVREGAQCEDTAILYASLIRTLGAGAILAAVDTDHDGTADYMITLVPVSQAYADAVTCEHGCVSSFWTYGGQLYAFAETMGEPDLMGYYFELGCDPWGLTQIDFKITWDIASVTVDPMIKKWTPLHSE